MPRWMMAEADRGDASEMIEVDHGAAGSNAGDGRIFCCPEKTSRMCLRLARTFEHAALSTLRASVNTGAADGSTLASTLTLDIIGRGQPPPSACRCMRQNTGEEGAGVNSSSAYEALPLAGLSEVGVFFFAASPPFISAYAR